MSKQTAERSNLEDRVRLLTAAIDDIRKRREQIAIDGKRRPVDDRRKVVHDRLTWADRRLAALLATNEQKLRAPPA